MTSANGAATASAEFDTATIGMGTQGATAALIPVRVGLTTSVLGLRTHCP